MMNIVMPKRLAAAASGRARDPGQLQIAKLCSAGQILVTNARSPGWPRRASQTG